MLRKILILIIVAVGLLSECLALEPLRVFIRAGEKSHAPGAHEYLRFAEDWKVLLKERGAVCDAGMLFPNRQQLENTDVLVLYAKDGGNIKGENRTNLEKFLQRGGGLVVIHAGSVSADPDWYRQVIGGSWREGQTQFYEGEMSLYFTDRENPITKDLSNFDLNDEIYYDMDILPEVQVLAAAYTPKLKEGKAGEKQKKVNIYDIKPQIWAYENTLKEGATPYRAFVSLPGHWYRNFSHPGIRALLLRGIAWAGKRTNVNEFCREQELGDALRYVEGGAPKAEDLVGEIEVHPDFEISLIASEPLINNPMNIDWDAKGRLWVCETLEYPNGLRKTTGTEWKDSGSYSPGNYEREPMDRISILFDTNGDGKMDQKKVFADKLELVTSFVFHRDGVIVCAAPDIWFLQDTDGDDVADKRVKLFTNLGNRDTHAVINNMRWGQDGWIYATHGYSASSNVTSGDGKKSFGVIGSGVVRFKPDGSVIEQYASRGGNTWGLELTREGEVFYTQPTTGNPLMQVMLPESILAKGKLSGVKGTVGLLPGAKTYPAMKWEQQAYVQIDQVGGYTAGAGCVIYEGGAWPEKWNHSYFTTEPTVNLVGQFSLKKKGVSYEAKRQQGRENVEFVRSRNLWFRPIDVRTGVDGALYVVDFCNQAVIHNDTRGPKHGAANASVRPDRDHYYGRIWRVQHKQARALPKLKLDTGNEEDLMLAVKSANKYSRETAQRLLRERYQTGLLPVGSGAVRVFRENEGNGDLAAIIEQVKRASDDWTLSALIAASASSSDRALEILRVALGSSADAQLVKFVGAMLPYAVEVEHGGNVLEVLTACSAAKPESRDLVLAVLMGLQAHKVQMSAFSEPLQVIMRGFLEQPDSQLLALPLILRWDQKDAMKDEVGRVAEGLAKRLNAAGEKLEERVAITRSLLALLPRQAQVKQVLKQSLQAEGDDDYKRELLILLGGASGMEAGSLILESLELGSPDLRALAFDQVMQRAERCSQLLDLIKQGKLQLASLGQINVGRLRNHPDKAIAGRANSLFDEMSPDVKQKSALIAKFRPEVEKPGDAVKGKMLFGACSVCHQLDGVGASVGPALDGMGAHGPAELLVHILDPNREVDPSFWAHNITTKKGEAYVGVITAQNAVSITLATQGGVKEIPKKQIAKQENTRRSLMPEGYEAFGAEGLRDLLAYICGDAALKWEEGKPRALLIGGGTSHEFKKFFGDMDKVILEKAGFSVNYTEDQQQAIRYLAEVDVVVISVNSKGFDSADYRKALTDRIAAGKGVVMLHPGVWYGYADWPELNAKVVGGGSRGHDKLGNFKVELVEREHPLMEGVTASFEVTDELYHVNAQALPAGTLPIKVLAKTSPSQKYGKPHPCVWVVENPKARIVGISLGHDERVHEHPDFQRILTNAVKWVKDEG